MTKYLDEKTIKKLMEQCSSKKKFKQTIRDFAIAGYIIPITVLQFVLNI